MVTATTQASSRIHLAGHHIARNPPASWAIAAAASPHAKVVHHGTDLVWLIAAVPTFIAAVVALIVWRASRRDRARRALAVRLANPVPLERRRVLDEVNDEVLARNSSVLLDLLMVERDPDVLDALAAAVARSRWEPTDDHSLIELRRWVAGGHARTTSTTVPAVTSTPEDEVDPFADGEDHWTAGDPLGTATDERAEERTADASTADASTVDQHTGDEPADATREPALTARSTDELDDFVPKVRAVLGDRVERVELALITGSVLKTWSSGDADDAAPKGRDGANSD
jgi:hypothetical protein